MSVVANIIMQPQAVTQPTVIGTDAAVSYNQFYTRETLTGSSTPSVDSLTALTQSLSSGAATIDLTTVPALVGNQSMSGKSLRVFYAMADSENAGEISIQTGATNGYAAFGSSGKFTLGAGDSVMIRLSTTNTVDGTHKTIDLSGTGTDSIDIQMLFG